MRKTNGKLTFHATKKTKLKQPMTNKPSTTTISAANKLLN